MSSEIATDASSRIADPLRVPWTSGLEQQAGGVWHPGADSDDICANRLLPSVAGTSKNRFAQSELFSYVPTGRYQVILFRESLQYVVLPKIKGMLDRYAEFLESGGVFIVRMLNLDVDTLVDVIESNYDIVEKHLSEQPKAIVLVFRARVT